MPESVITVENLSKRYLVGHQAAERSRYTALRDVIGREARNYLRKAADFARGREIVQGDVLEEFWALKDVNFEVKQGDVLGIIGHNGAGKSTLLKILSRITEPTRGRVTIRGRIASLLEVGTGFHPELTGRENIFLNGAILGMTRVEIKSKFDEIVAFAEIETFLDTPVKRYSSGMYVRLAFAVAAHLEPEILLVDEVLAVGDVKFQRKCLGKMSEVAHGGRTVLLVSHNMAAIANLSHKVLFLQSGAVAALGPTQKVIEDYLRAGAQVSTSDVSARTDRSGNGALQFEAVELRDGQGNPVTNARSGDDLVIALRYRNRTGKPLRNVHVAIAVHGAMEENLFHLSTSVVGDDFDEIPDAGYFLCKLKHLPLRAGNYPMNIFCQVSGEITDWVQRAAYISVDDGDFFGTGKLPPDTHGAILVEHSWAAR